MKQVIFRVDSSALVGSGHLMRCLTLANQLKTKAKIIFISRDLDGNLNDLIVQNGFELLKLPQRKINDKLEGYECWLGVSQEIDAEETKVLLADYAIELLVVDSYAIDEIWEKKLRSYVKRIMVIDDLANRKHDCDILLDQNYYSDMYVRYNYLVPKHCKLLLGPQYVLLRDEFYKVKKQQRKRDGQIRNILVFFGGSDLTNETMKSLQALVLLKREDITVNVVVGGSNQYKDEVAAFCRRYPWMYYYCQVNNMAELMNEADLAIGAGGTATWERCFLGLPAIVIAVAKNQVKISKDCAKVGFIEYLGINEGIELDGLIKSISKYVNNSELLLNMSDKAAQLGLSKRIQYLFD